MADSSRHHHNPEVLLKQFAEPMLSDNIRLFEKKTGRWNTDRRTPYGVGWSRHLYSAVDNSGKRHDRFEQFLSKHVDDHCAAVLKKAAVDFKNLEGEDYGYLAHFISFCGSTVEGASGDRAEGAKSQTATGRPCHQGLVRQAQVAVRRG